MHLKEITSMNKQRTMKFWALVKWRWNSRYYDYTRDIVQNSLLLINKYRQLGKYFSECSYCEEYHRFFKCNGCPINLLGQCCITPNTTYRKWFKSVREKESTQAKKYAKQMLYLIRFIDAPK